MGLPERRRHLREVIDEVLSSLGPAVREVVYHYCESKFGARREEVHLKLDALASCLEEIFGEVARFIEARILERLSARLGVDLRGSRLRELRVEDLLSSASPTP